MDCVDDLGLLWVGWVREICFRCVGDRVRRSYELLFDGDFKVALRFFVFLHWFSGNIIIEVAIGLKL